MQPEEHLVLVIQVVMVRLVIIVAQVHLHTWASASEVRAHLSATGLVSYNNSTGVTRTTADNYTSWTVETDTGSTLITSGEKLTILGGTNINVTNSKNTLTIMIQQILHRTLVLV